jgi:hypothetical protein
LLELVQPLLEAAVGALELIEGILVAPCAVASPCAATAPSAAAATSAASTASTATATTTSAASSSAAVFAHASCCDSAVSVSARAAHFVEATIKPDLGRRVRRRLERRGPAPLLHLAWAAAPVRAAPAASFQGEGSACSVTLT